jgi:hypothetical protein
VTDTVPLNDEIVYNNKRVYCCVCARKGHWAEECTSINKTVSGIMLPGSYEVKSHKPAYSPPESDVRNEQVFNLITYLDNYHFNFDGKFSNGGFYSRIPNLKPAETSSLAKNFSFVREMEKSENDRFKLDFLTADKTLQVTVDANGSNRHIRFHDSNEQDVEIAETNELPDFIALENEENKEVNTKPQEKEEEELSSKVLLSKNHAKIMESGAGVQFIKQMKDRFAITMEFGCDDAVGDFILIKGLPASQKVFRSELTNFVFKIEYDQYEKHCMMSTQIPKDRQKIIQYLQQILGSLKKHYQSPDKIYSDLLEAEKTYDFKKVFKCRKILNLILLGQQGLGEGKKHLSALKVIMIALQNDQCSDKQVQKELRNDISEHMRYIFSPEKRDYTRLLNEYFARKLQNKSASNVSPIKSNNETNKSQHLMQMVNRCRYILTNVRIHENLKNQSVIEMLTEYQRKIVNGNFSNKNAKKLKALLEMLEQKVK